MRLFKTHDGKSRSLVYGHSRVGNANNKNVIVHIKRCIVMFFLLFKKNSFFSMVTSVLESFLGGHFCLYFNVVIILTH